MGCATSTPASAEKKEINKEIEKELRADRAEEKRTIKLLLLGTGESGKSTIVKQMKVIHLDGFTEQELQSFVKPIHNNIAESVKVLMGACASLGFDIDEKWTTPLEKYTRPRASVTPEDAPHIKGFWELEDVQKAFQKRSQFQVPDPCKYYLSEIERICTKGFVPNEEDVIRCRARTTGIREIAMEIDSFTFQVIDVGGQRSERRKWFHCFEQVTALIFVTAVNEYDMVLYENQSVNRMDESLNLFKDIVNNEYFRKSSVILFLNKIDLFKEKLRKSEISSHFPEYTGGKDLELGLKFLEEKFLEQNNAPGKNIYVHQTTATDRENIEFVFAAVRHTIISRGLAMQGF